MSLDLSALDGLQIGKPSKGSGVAMRAPLDAFDEDPDNPRFETDDQAFEALVADVGERGILQPIVVRLRPNGRLQIRFGMRRYRAALRNALPDAPYIVTEDPRQFDDYAQVAENEMRMPLQPLELAMFIEKKIIARAHKNQIAKSLHIDPSALSHLLALVGKVPPLILELYHARKCRSPSYLYELRRLAERAPELVGERCARAEVINRAFINLLADEVQNSVRHAAMPGEGAAREAGAPAELPTANLPGPAGARGSTEANSSAAASPARSSAGAVLGPEMMRRPELVGRVGDRDVILDLRRAPTSPSRVWVRDGDALLDVALASVALQFLRDAAV
jgi:ParB family chromosome partitioning protein